MNFYGENPCEGFYQHNQSKCRNKSYFKDTKTGKCFCGLHKPKEASELPRNPAAAIKKQRQIDDHANGVIFAKNGNANASRKGKVMCSKMGMFKPPTPVEGYLFVFPNARHGGRKDGLGIPELSPKIMGPVNHGMPNMPVALTIENYHQFAKVFPEEADMFGNVLENTLKQRREAYSNPIGIRHKPAAKGGKVVPLYSSYYDKEGKEHRFKYVESRWFYCKEYERIAKDSPKFLELRNKIQDGYNLNICGYDGYNVTKPLYDHYLDPSKPFGHEMVLYSMLTVDDPKNYPWNQYQEKNIHLYKDF